MIWVVNNYIKILLIVVLLCNNNYLPFDQLLENNRSFAIHHKNAEAPVTEIFILQQSIRD